MAISLRIVGIFYTTKVELEGGRGTVKDVLVAAENQITTGDSFSFGRTTVNGKESPNMFRAFYESGVTSVSSGIHYPKGEYMLTETFPSSPSYTVWQYYIVDENGVTLNRGKGFVPYDDPVNAIVEDGQSVIWRLLTVRDAPTDPSPKLQKMLA